MPSNDLIVYIRNQAHNHTSSEEIRATLLHKGWAADQITLAMKQALPVHPLRQWIDHRLARLLLALLIFLCGCAVYVWYSSVPVTDIRVVPFTASTGWASFTSKTAPASYSLLYPPGWRLQDSSDSLTIHGPSQSVVTITETTNRHGLDTTYTTIQQDESQKKLNIISHRSYQINKVAIDETVFVTEPSDHTPPYYTVISELPANDVLVQVQLTFPNKIRQSLQLQTIYLQLLHSFRISPPSAHSKPPPQAVHL